MFIRWGNTNSTKFLVTNGVKHIPAVYKYKYLGIIVIEIIVMVI